MAADRVIGALLRGFVFTLDAFLALVLALFAISAMLYVSSAPNGTAESYSRLYLLADDAIGVLAGTQTTVGGEKFSQENTLASIGRSISGGDLLGAKKLAGSSLEPIVPVHLGFSVEYEKSPGEWAVVYSRSKPQGMMRASSVRIVSGKKSSWEANGQCVQDNCPFCDGPPKGSIEGESFGPLAIRVSVWV